MVAPRKIRRTDAETIAMGWLAVLLCLHQMASAQFFRGVLQERAPRRTGKPRRKAVRDDLGHGGA